MNPIAHLTNRKFKDLTAVELLEVANAFIDKNRYNCVEEYISFEEWFALSHFAREPEVKNVIQYFENEYFSIYKLKDFFKQWVD